MDMNFEREWSMKNGRDWAYWTETMKRCIYTLIVVSLLPAFIQCCGIQLYATDIGVGHSRLPKADQGWGYYCTQCPYQEKNACFLSICQDHRSVALLFRERQ